MARGLITGQVGKIHLWMWICTVNTEEEAVYDVKVNKWDTLEICEGRAGQSRTAATDRSRAWFIVHGPKFRPYFHSLSWQLRERLNCWNIWSFQVQVSYAEMCARLLNSERKLLKLVDAKYNSLCSGCDSYTGSPPDTHLINKKLKYFGIGLSKSWKHSLEHKTKWCQ